MTGIKRLTAFVCSVHHTPALMMVKPALHCAALLLLLLLPGTLAAENKMIPFDLVVKNLLCSDPLLTYNTSVVEEGILLGGMRRLMDATPDFKFTYTDNLNFGPFLESVNGVAGSPKDSTYWRILTEAPNGTITPIARGIGCYIPKKNEKIILNFTRY